ncbi:MAG: aminopeptidase, partial [Defluviitaleaceae bacterium]|nr:aminopeptidase [Defluviitaleaceae bacterium]
TRYLRAADACFDEYPEWRVDRFKHYDDRGVAYIHLRSSDPDLLSGVDPGRIKRQTKVSRSKTKDHTTLTMSGALRWSLAALPSPAWAKKIFPGLGDEAAVEKLWGLILKGARADGGDPIGDWVRHKENFAARVDYLNKKSFASLRMVNGKGTDLTIGLAKNHVWRGGGDTAQDGIDFFPNMPTEEIFTMPDKSWASGRVVASMPLSYQGNLIEDFEIDFEGGGAVSWKARSNGAILDNIIEMDEGSRRLGEIAIVANSSPIAGMKTLFYETLFDENASCHLALGKAYPSNLKGGDKLSEEGLCAAGANDSLIHVDFMFGTPDLKIIGTEGCGTEVCFYENGEFTGIA